MAFSNDGAIGAIGTANTRGTTGVDLWTKLAEQREQPKNKETDNLKFYLCGAMQPHAYMN